MPLLDVPPTKAALLELKEQLAVAKSGYDLLEEKREVLISELLNIIDDAESFRREVNEQLVSAFHALMEAIETLGPDQVKRTTLACIAEAHITLTERSVMGVPIPLMKRKLLKLAPQYGLLGTSYALDEALRRFYDVLERILRLAETERTAWHLAIELKKTQRRVNALENIFIPQYEETIRYIEERLEEVERETIFQMKLLKEKKGG
ncbi:MAG TPA: V-type ATP synthase subunit D [Candidatus Acetothermia bacterium]|nr:V-type ATP synthase subunit D [Candidatus Acetothermia bacterium]